VFRGGYKVFGGGYTLFREGIWCLEVVIECFKVVIGCSEANPDELPVWFHYRVFRGGYMVFGGCFILFREDIRCLVRIYGV